MGAETEDRDQKGHKDGKSHAGIKNGSNRETERICSGSIPLRTQYASDFWMGPATLTHWKGPIREANNLNREEKKKKEVLAVQGIQSAVKCHTYTLMPLDPQKLPPQLCHSVLRLIQL